MNVKKQKISIVVPVYNELRNVGKLIGRISEALSALENPFEIIFVDDNSTDGTYEYLSTFRKSSKVKVFKKRGKKGKAYSLAEGFENATGTILGMIDADLQYPPEQLPKMIIALEAADVIVANRKNYQDARVRKILSKTFRYIFGRVFFSLDHDIQSGMKVFTRNVFEAVKFVPQSPWTFDLEFLHRAKETGFTIKDHDITFAPRKEGNSQVKFLKTTWEIGSNAIAVKTKHIPPLVLPPDSENSMVGAGIGYKRNRYVTHTVLPHTQSALITFALSQKVFLWGCLGLILIGLLVKPLFTLQIAIGVLSVIYFVDVLFNLFLILQSLHSSGEVVTTQEEVAALSEKNLPIYSILCPLYKEAHVVPQFLSSIKQLDWPKNKLDVILLIEEDDVQTQNVIKNMALPSYVRMLVVPHSIPKTKPKACNYGLSFAKGEYLVIFDAEDKPESDQLKKAFVAFGKLSRNIICLQAKLNYYNPHQNLLTRLFTAEYSLWFDVTLSGLQALNTALPLGGTSNHFRTEDLRSVLGWDPFNVTEDADLGMRLFKKGYQTAMIDSTTYEEANSNGKNWLRQRSRWIKGYMQTYLVHNRDFFRFLFSNGVHATIFHLIIGGKIAFILINPLLWITTISYFVLYRYVGAGIESLYPSYVFYMAGFSLVFGNFLFVYYYMIGCMKRGQWSLIKYVYLVPFYWLMISIAGGIAFYQLLFKPHYWEKTIHGLHLKKQTADVVSEVVIEIEKEDGILLPKRLQNIIRGNLARHHIVGGIFILASMVGSFCNFLYHAYLGRVLSLEDIALVGFANGIYSFVGIAAGSFGSTMGYKTGYLIGKFGEHGPVSFWRSTRKRALLFSLIATSIWIAVSPLLAEFFNVDGVHFFLILSPVIVVMFTFAADKGFLSSRLNFLLLAIIAVFEPLVRFLLSIALVSLGLGEWVYIAIPIAVVYAFLLCWFFLAGTKTQKDVAKSEERFPKKFFFASLISGISSIIFLNLDVVLAKHYLSAIEAGQYILVALIAKIIFFLGAFVSPFIIPFVSRNEGANKDSSKVLYYTLLATLFFTLPGFIGLGVFGEYTAPFLFGEKARDLVPFLPLACFAMLCFTLSRVFTDYYISKKYYVFAALTFFLASVELVALSQLHDDVTSFVMVMSITWSAYFILTLLLHAFAYHVKIIENNIGDFLGLFASVTTKYYKSDDSINILIFNWRDTKHRWAGGAEVYIHELAKRWVEQGHRVTLFCGSDSQRVRDEVIDGVHIYRRGGFYTVYAWAFLYYMFKFRGQYDVIVDSENGIPFFTPFYTRVKTFLLIHHVHQEVFRKSLRWPFSSLALFLEAKLMPWAYRNVQVITVSPSSKNEILRHKLTKTEPIIIYNGVDLSIYKPGKKSKKPMVLYLGRLQYYKSLHIFIKAAKKVLEQIPEAKFFIAGEGEQRQKLEMYTKKLGIDGKVRFLGKVSEREKIALFQNSWVFVNPSLMEGWGITTIEANACGTPTVASNVPGLRDSIKHAITGQLVRYGDVDGFTTELIGLLKNESLRHKMSEDAREWAGRFSWSKSSQRFMALIVSSLTNKPRLSYRRPTAFVLTK